MILTDTVQMTPPRSATSATDFRRRLSPTQSGSIFGFLSACGWLRNCCSNAGSSSLTKPFGVWAQKFGPDYARRLKRKKPIRRDIWHLDEVVITINGEKRYLWRAVDQDGYVLDEIVQIRRDTRAAKRLLERLLRKQGCPPKRMITDKLGSYGAARRKIMPKVEHRQHKGLNNRAENSHVPLRKWREAIHAVWGIAAGTARGCPALLGRKARRIK